MDDNIILIGFMGTGKDAVGKALARQTGKVFLSTDKMIELCTGMKIKEIFASHGQAYFRLKEKEILCSIRYLKNLVVATGGGIVLKNQNRQMLAAMGKVIGLSARPRVIATRLIHQKNRPLLESKDDIVKLLRERKGRYDFADVTFDTSYQHAGAIARKIKAQHYRKEKLPDIKKIIKISTKNKTYSVVINPGLLAKKQKLKTLTDLDISRAVVVTNPLVSALYEHRVRGFLRRHEIASNCFIIPDSESAKTLEYATALYDFLLAKHMTRYDAIIALGGGVVGDLAGFVAATYKRGMKYLQIPTTLLAQVDAAIGGKCGVNYAWGKNMIGTFYQPDLVIADPALLRTLSARDFRNGLAEIIKYSIIHNQTFFSKIERQHTELAQNMLMLASVIAQCVEIKGNVVHKDEYEHNQKRQILNLGHTIGHAIESFTGFSRYSHGEAVAMGIIAEAGWAVREKLLGTSVLQRIARLIHSCGLPTKIPGDIKKKHLTNAIIEDKKIHNNKIDLPLIKNIGQVIIKEVSCKTYW